MKIEGVGDTELVIEEQVDPFRFTEENERVIAAGGRPATGRPFLCTRYRVFLRPPRAFFDRLLRALVAFLFVDAVFFRPALIFRGALFFRPALFFRAAALFAGGRAGPRRDIGGAAAGAPGGGATATGSATGWNGITSGCICDVAATTVWTLGGE